MQIKKFCKTSIKTKNTKYFYIIIFVIIALFSAAYVHNNNIAYIVLFFIFSISLFSLTFGRLNIKKANFSLPEIHPFANTPIKIPLIPKGEFYDVLFNNQQILIHTFTKRGYNDLNVTLSNNYPLNLAIFSKTITFKDILVYPELKGISLKKSYFGKSENVDFEGLKNYNFEDIKYIHFPSLAKGSLQVKHFSGDGKTEKLTFDINKLTKNKESNISQIALWSYEAFKEGIEFEIILDKKIDSKEGFDEIFTKLALY